jgi:hypothetical protein
MPINGIKIQENDDSIAPQNNWTKNPKYNPSRV